MAPYIQFALGSDIGDDVKHDVGDDASCILMDSTIPNPHKGRVVGYKTKENIYKIILTLWLPSIKQSYSPKK